MNHNESIISDLETVNNIIFRKVYEVYSGNFNYEETIPFIFHTIAELMKDDNVTLGEFTEFLLEMYLLKAIKINDIVNTEVKNLIK